MHGSEMGGAEGQGVQGLYGKQQKRVDGGADHAPAQHSGHCRNHEKGGRCDPGHDGATEGEQQHFSHDPRGPQHADHVVSEPGLAPEQGSESVIGAVAGLNQPRGDEKEQKLRLSEDAS